jgi:hypothetical protein
MIQHFNENVDQYFLKYSNILKNVGTFLKKTLHLESAGGAPTRDGRPLDTSTRGVAAEPVSSRGTRGHSGAQ